MLTLRPADADARRWRQIASLSELPQNVVHDSNGASLVPDEPTVRNTPVQPTLADKLCYGCLVPFLEAQGKSKASSDHLPLLATLPTYTEDLLALRGQDRQLRRDDLRKEIEDFLL